MGTEPPGVSTDTGLTTRLRSYGLGVEALAWWSGVCFAEAMAVLVYLQVASVAVTDVRYVVYPFVWINVGLWAAMSVDVAANVRDHRQHAFALGGAALYALLLFLAGGLLQVGAGGPGTALDVRFDATPGWAPFVFYDGVLVQLSIVPFKLVGYLSLAYLVYARLLEATRGVVAGLLGLVSCVGCTFSILLPLAGATALFGTAITTYTWDLSTVVFPLTVALLYWNDEAYGWIRRRLP